VYLARRLPIAVGILLMAMSIIALIGWNSLNWSLVDPYFCTLVFVSGPFFVGMSLANPRVDEVPAPGTHP
jgi:hypothetical protein